MERNDHDNTLPVEDMNKLEERRIQMLDDAGINEQEVLDTAGKDMNSWTSYFQENITRGKDDANFCLRDQWTAVERSEFTRLFKPAMTFNKLYDNVKKIAGEQRKNKPDLIVRSLTGKASQKQIDLRADLVRTIAYQSETDLVYQTAFRSALITGFGAFQILLDYESPRSFNKVVRYDIIPDATMCMWDPTASKPHKGDGNYCGRSYLLTRDEFNATYPYVTNPVSFVNPYMLMDIQRQTKDTITLCDIYKKEWFPLRIIQLDNGDSVTEEEWENIQDIFKKESKMIEGSQAERILMNGLPKIKAERLTQDYKVMHYRMLRDQIVDFSEWPSRQLPIPFVDGDSYWHDGRQYTKSFIHEARDAQKCVNYFNSEIASEIKNRRREQWIGTPDNIAGQEQMWRNPELQMGILLAKPDPKSGAMPIKMPAWEISQGLMMNAQRAAQDIREILGFSETEELQGRDVSGKARRERKLEGAMSAYVFYDNLNQAIAQGGRVVNDLLPHIAGDDERHMVITKADSKSQSIILNKRGKDGEIENQIEAGDFDVEIDTGASFAVQKEISLEFLQQTMAVAPQSFPLIADLWVKQLDLQFMPQMAERFKSMVPKDILAKEAGEPPPPPPPPSPEQQMMEAEMKNKQAEIQERAEELQIRKQKHQLEEAELILKAQELKAKGAREEKTHQVDMAKSDMDFTAKIAKILVDAHKA